MHLELELGNSDPYEIADRLRSVLVPTNRNDVIERHYEFIVDGDGNSLHLFLLIEYDVFISTSYA
jgi:hypothetical protein